MLRQMAGIAPLWEWLHIGLAALLVTLGIVGVAHLYIAIRGYRDRDLHPLSPGSLMTSMRWTVFLFASGFSIAGLDLDWPIGRLLLLTLLGAAAAVGETIARIRSGIPPRI